MIGSVVRLINDTLLKTLDLEVFLVMRSAITLFVFRVSDFLLQECRVLGDLLLDD